MSAALGRAGGTATQRGLGLRVDVLRRRPFRQAHLRNIYRYDAENHGWLVAFKRQGTTRTKFFSDSAYGGDAGALRVAKLYRDAMAARLPPPRKFHRVSRRNTSGTIGVHRLVIRGRNRARRHCYWVATWQEADGRKRCIAFSVARLGPGTAKAKAAQARKEALARMLGRRT